MDKLKVLVTGPCGLLGNNIVRELLKRGYAVRAFIHNVHVTSLDDCEVERLHGDILVEKEVLEAAKGVDYIIHAAANTSIWPYRSEIIRKVNIEGTRNIIKAAQANNVKRLIAIGSATAFGNGTKDNPGTEESAFTAGRFGLDYIDSKFESQKIVLEAVEHDKLPAIILNPTFMLGPYDTKPSSGELLLALYSGKVPGYTNGGRNYVHVQDVAVASCNALTMGRIGQCYIMANHNLSYVEFNKMVAEELKVKAPGIFVPAPIILLYGVIAEGIARLLGKAPAISLAIAKISLITNYYSSDKAREELDMPQTPIQLAIHDAFDWFKDNDFLNRK
jgi:dihydroflavonol-4-reductase